jgi:hypothetical protein
MTKLDRFFDRPAETNQAMGRLSYCQVAEGTYTRNTRMNVSTFFRTTHTDDTDQGFFQKSARQRDKLRVSALLSICCMSRSPIETSARQTETLGNRTVFEIN